MTNYYDTLDAINKAVAVKDDGRLAILRELAEPIIFSFDKLNPKWLVEKRWAAVPMPDGYLESRGEQAKRMATVLRTCGHTECFGVITEPSLKDACTAQHLHSDDVAAFVIPSNEDAILDFHAKRIFAAAIFPPDRSFIVSFAPNDIYIAGGKREIVEQLIGRDLDLARNEILRPAEASDQSKRATQLFAKYLLALKSDYEQFDGIN